MNLLVHVSIIAVHILSETGVGFRWFRHEVSSDTSAVRADYLDISYHLVEGGQVNPVSYWLKPRVKLLSRQGFLAHTLSKL